MSGQLQLGSCSAALRATDQSDNGLEERSHRGPPRMRLRLQLCFARRSAVVKLSSPGTYRSPN